MGYLRWTVKPSARLRMLRSICVTEVHCGEIWGRKLGAMTQDWALWWDQYSNNAFSSLSWQAKYWHDPSAQQRVLCAVFAVKSMSVKTCLGSGRRGGAWGCSQPGLLEEVWGKGANRAEDTAQHISTVPTEPGNFVVGFCPWSTELLVLLFSAVSPLSYASHVWQRLRLHPKRYKTWPSTEAKRWGSRSWAAGKASAECFGFLSCMCALGPSSAFSLVIPGGFPETCILSFADRKPAGCPPWRSI